MQDISLLDLKNSYQCYPSKSSIGQLYFHLTSSPDPTDAVVAESEQIPAAWFQNLQNKKKSQRKVMGVITAQ